MKSVISEALKTISRGFAFVNVSEFDLWLAGFNELGLAV